ncbi:hypothetical protein GJ496_009297 [Pomphorhynchus laevis]|nr:hypothetical protein GJ496_009297 [Pomphorhynchus laevis]
MEVIQAQDMILSHIRSSMRDSTHRKIADVREKSYQFRDKRSRKGSFHNTEANRIAADCEAENHIRGRNQKIKAADKCSVVQDGFQVHTRQQIFQKLIPSIIGTKIISKEAEHISSLPLRKGCLGVVDPYHIAGTEYANSYAMCTPLIDFNQASDLTITQDAIRKGIGAAREQMYEEELRELHDQTNGKWKHLLQYASGRGASSWLSGNRLKALDVV